jgi:hypothetical protein
MPDNASSNRPQPTFAFVERLGAVRMSGDTPCPCGRMLQASDWLETASDSYALDCTCGRRHIAIELR